jgi:hypothetical protein
MFKFKKNKKMSKKEILIIFQNKIKNRYFYIENAAEKNIDNNLRYVDYEEKNTIVIYDGMFKSIINLDLWTCDIAFQVMCRVESVALTMLVLVRYFEFQNIYINESFYIDDSTNEIFFGEEAEFKSFKNYENNIKQQWNQRNILINLKKENLFEC